MSDDERSRPRTTRPGQEHPSPTLTLVPLLALARELAVLLIPVRPDSSFRSELHDSLVTAGRQQQAQLSLQILPPGDSVWPTGRHLMIGAAVGSAVSLAGIVAYLWRHRNQRAA